MAGSYYPMTIAGRADWWANIEDKSAVLTGIGFGAPKVAGIMADAAWGVYLYDDLRTTFENFESVIIAYANDITGGGEGGALPDAPVVPALPAAPATAITTGLEKRREDWVGEVKKNPLYTTSVGEALRIIAPEDTFNPETYKTVLLNVRCTSPKTVSGRFRKASGHADGVIIRARKLGAMAFAEIGRFTAMPFSVLIPLAGNEPETWEFQAQVFRRDQPFGVPSDIVELVVKP